MIGSQNIKVTSDSTDRMQFCIKKHMRITIFCAFILHHVSADFLEKLNIIKQNKDDDDNIKDRRNTLMIKIIFQEKFV